MTVYLHQCVAIDVVTALQEIPDLQILLALHSLSVFTHTDLQNIISCEGRKPELYVLGERLSAIELSTFR